MHVYMDFQLWDYLSAFKYTFLQNTHIYSIIAVISQLMSDDCIDYCCIVIIVAFASFSNIQIFCFCYSTPQQIKYCLLN